MGCSCSRASAGQEIREIYRVGNILGSGSFGLVRLCVKKSTGEQFAVKIMSKDPPKDKRGGNNVDFAQMFLQEVALLGTLDHPNVIKFHEFFEDRHFLYAVMDKCDGGELFTHIVRRKRFTEDDASALCRQMLESIKYVHNCGIVHRDIKAENFLFSDPFSTCSAGGGHLVLIDFGMSTRIPDDRCLKQLCGSPHYVAPELIRRCYRFKVDMWALGVVIFLMLYGKYPFEGVDQKAIVHAILNGQPDYTRSRTPPSATAIDFMSSLLQKDPDKRLDPEQALEHPWITETDRTALEHFEIAPEIVREARRNAESSKDPVEIDKRIRQYERKLTELDEKHAAAASAGTHHHKQQRRHASHHDTASTSTPTAATTSEQHYRYTGSGRHSRRSRDHANEYDADARYSPQHRTYRLDDPRLDGDNENGDGDGGGGSSRAAAGDSYLQHQQHRQYRRRPSHRREPGGFGGGSQQSASSSRRSSRLPSLGGVLSSNSDGSSVELVSSSQEVGSKEDINYNANETNEKNDRRRGELGGATLIEAATVDERGEFGRDGCRGSESDFVGHHKSGAACHFSPSSNSPNRHRSPLLKTATAADDNSSACGNGGGRGNEHASSGRGNGGNGHHTEGGEMSGVVMEDSSSSSASSFKNAQQIRSGQFVQNADFEDRASSSSSSSSLCCDQRLLSRVTAEHHAAMPGSCSRPRALGNFCEDKPGGCRLLDSIDFGSCSDASDDHSDFGSSSSSSSSSSNSSSDRRSYSVRSGWVDGTWQSRQSCCSSFKPLYHSGWPGCSQQLHHNCGTILDDLKSSSFVQSMVGRVVDDSMEHRISESLDTSNRSRSGNRNLRVRVRRTYGRSGSGDNRLALSKKCIQPRNNPPVDSRGDADRSVPLGRSGEDSASASIGNEYSIRPAATFALIDHPAPSTARSDSPTSFEHQISTTTTNSSLRFASPFSASQTVTSPFVSDTAPPSYEDCHSQSPHAQYHFGHEERNNSTVEKSPPAGPSSKKNSALSQQQTQHQISVSSSISVALESLEGAERSSKSPDIPPDGIGTGPPDGIGTDCLSNNVEGDRSFEEIYSLDLGCPKKDVTSTTTAAGSRGSSGSCGHGSSGGGNSRGLNSCGSGSNGRHYSVGECSIYLNCEPQKKTPKIKAKATTRTSLLEEAVSAPQESWIRKSVKGAIAPFYSSRNKSTKRQSLFEG